MLTKPFSRQSVRYAAVTKAVVQKTSPVLYFSRGQKRLFHQALSEDDEAPLDLEQGVKEKTHGDKGTYRHSPTENSVDSEPEPYRAFGQISKPITGASPFSLHRGQTRRFHASVSRHAEMDPSNNNRRRNEPNNNNGHANKMRKPKATGKSAKRRQALASQDLRSGVSPSRSPVMQCLAYASAERYDLVGVATELNRQEVPFTLAFEQDRADQAIVVSGWNFGVGAGQDSRQQEAASLKKLADEAARRAQVTRASNAAMYHEETTPSHDLVQMNQQSKDSEIWIFKSGSIVTWGMSATEGWTFIRNVIRSEHTPIEFGPVPFQKVQTEEVDYAMDHNE